MNCRIYFIFLMNFRFKEAEIPRKKGFLKLGSKFRYSGRTLYQSKMVVSAVDRPMPSFDRIHSKRATFGGRPNKRHDVEGIYRSVKPFVFDILIFHFILNDKCHISLIFFFIVVFLTGLTLPHFCACPK